MPIEPTFAFKVCSILDGKPREHIVQATDLAVATREAQERLAGAGARLVRVELVGEALPWGWEEPGAGPRDRQAHEPEPSSDLPATFEDESGDAAGDDGSGTRIAQLLELLNRRPGPLHLNEIALGLGITRKNANSIVMRAGRAGLVRRLGNRSGKVELS